MPLVHLCIWLRELQLLYSTLQLGVCWHAPVTVQPEEIAYRLVEFVKHPRRRLLRHTTFVFVDHTIRDSGTLQVRQSDSGHGQTVRNARLSTTNRQ